MPVYGANKEMIQLQTQVDLQQTTQLKQSLEQDRGVMKNLLEQNTNATKNRMMAQRRSNTLDKFKIQLAKVSKQLEDTRAAQPSIGQ